MIDSLELSWTTVPVGSFAAFAGASLLIELTPGPNMGYLAIVSAQQGRKAGFLVVAGVAVGLAVYLSLSIVGVAEGLLEYPAIYQSLRWGGVAYMLWLAVEALRPLPAHTGSLVKLGAARLFGRGFIANLLNVKAALFYVAVLPGFIEPELGGLASQASQLGGLHILIATAVHATIVIAATLRPTSLYSNRMRTAYAIGLVSIACWLAWSTSTR